MKTCAALLFSLVPGVFAASISSTCSPPYASELVVTTATANSSSCSSLGSYSYPQNASGGASASASVNLSLATNSSDWSTLSTSQTLFAGEAVDNLSFGLGAAAHTLVNWTETLTTAGPLRSGYLQIMGDGSSSYFYDGQGLMTSGILSGDPNSPMTEISCATNNFSGCSPGPHYYSLTNPLIPFVLGTNFDVAATGHVNDSATLNEGQSSGTLNTTFQFRFLELDGVTPVAVNDVPEPATWTLLCLGIGAALAAKRRRNVQSDLRGGQSTLASKSERN